MRGAHEFLRESLRVLVNHFKFVDELLFVVNLYRSAAHLIRLHNALRFLILIHKSYVGLHFVCLDERRVGVLELVSRLR